MVSDATRWNKKYWYFTPSRRQSETHLPDSTTLRVSDVKRSRFYVVAAGCCWNSQTMMNLLIHFMVLLCCLQAELTTCSGRSYLIVRLHLKAETFDESRKLVAVSPHWLAGKWCHSEGVWSVACVRPLEATSHFIGFNKAERANSWRQTSPTTNLVLKLSLVCSSTDQRSIQTCCLFGKCLETNTLFTRPSHQIYWQKQNIETASTTLCTAFFIMKVQKCEHNAQRRKQ